MGSLPGLRHPSGSPQDTLESIQLEPIAVIGYSLRFPQEADNAESFWSMLLEGRCVSTDVPAERLNIDTLYHPDGDRADSLPLRGAHFLKGDIAAFDAPFFSITRSEATGMDPQQRILLETTYRAIENAGLPLEKIAGTKTSVHTGCFSNDYTLLQAKDVEKLPRYSATGNAPSLLANRISWFFDLHGASVNLDSACSSSAMAVDLGCQSLWNNESSMGIVAGCNLIFSLDGLASLSGMNFLSHDSRCFSFDQRASGYSRGEGFAVILLKRLSDALKDSDVIRAVIRSTTSNQDGRTPGITNPSKKSQEDLIRHTYKKAGLDLNKTRYFESHGTGTAIGDPTEAGAIGTAFRRTPDQEPLKIGALKSNIGHLEGASGVAAVVKAIMVLEKGVIPPNANFEVLNPRIDAEYYRLEFPTKPIVWGPGLRRASVNCFGFGGANTHIVLEDAYHHLLLRGLRGTHSTVIRPELSTSLVPHRESATLQLTNGTSAVDDACRESEIDGADSRPRLFVFSSADENGIDRLGKAYAQHVTCLNPLRDEAFLDDLAYTLLDRRESFPWKSFVVASTPGQFKDLSKLLSKPRQSIKGAKSGFIFTGQGSQWNRMGIELMAYPVYQKALRAADAFLQSLGSKWSLIDEISCDNSRIDEPGLSQPLCTALQIGLVDLLRSFEVSPSIVVGHSSGEIAAAYSIGAISMETALKIAYYRGLLASEVENQGQEGAMLAVGLSEDQVTPYFNAVAANFGHLGMNVGCINSPCSVTISGNADQIDFLASLLERDSVFCRKLRVKVAYHSGHMKVISDAYLRVLGDLQVGEQSQECSPMISSVTGKAVSHQELRDPAYWVSNLVSPVRFSDALRVMWSGREKTLRKKIDGSHRQLAEVPVLLEVGPHSTLQGPVRDLLQTLSTSKRVTYASVLIRNKPAIHTLLQALGTIYCAGCAVNIGAANFAACASRAPRPLVNLPQYPFDHSQTYWSESRASKSLRFPRIARHDLLGSATADSNALNGSWRGFLKLNELPWMKDHKITDSTVYPAAGMMAMAIEAAKQMADQQRPIKGYMLKDVAFQSVIQVTTDEEGVEVYTYLTPFEREINMDSPMYGFRIMTCVNSTWTQCCSGSIQVVYVKSANDIDQEEERLLQASCVEKINLCQKEFRKVDREYLYERLEKCGYGYGPYFQALRNISCNDKNQAMADVELFQWTLGNLWQPHVVHPTQLDCVFQLIFTALSSGGSIPLATIVPTAIRKTWISNSGLSSPSPGPIRAHTSSHWISKRTALSNIYILAADRQVCGQIEEMETACVAKTVEDDTIKSMIRPCYRIEWRPDPDLLTMDGPKTPGPAAERTLFYRDLEIVHRHYIRQFIRSGPSDPQLLDPKYQQYTKWLHRLEPYLNNSVSIGSFEGSPRVLEDSPYDLKDSSCVLKNSSYDLEDSPCGLKDSPYNSEDSPCGHPISVVESRLDAYGKRGKLSTSVGRNLSKILAGKVDFSSGAGEENMISNVHEDVFGANNCMDYVKQYLQCAAHKRPGMRVLEIGMGMSGMTRNLAEGLGIGQPPGETGPPSCIYEYADKHPRYLEIAAKNLPTIPCSFLDIDRDPVSQGFGAESYDLIVISSTLHGSSSPEQAMKSLGQLLKPGGQLVQVEMTKPESYFSQFILGLLPAWWLKTSSDEPKSPCLSEDQWMEFLPANGFKETAVLARDTDDDFSHEVSILVSSYGPQRATAAEVQSQDKAAIVLNGQSHGSYGLAQKLKAMLGRFFEQCDILDLEGALESQVADRFCVLLPGMELALLSASEEEFHLVKTLLLSAKCVLWIASNDSSRSSRTPEHFAVEGLLRTLRSEMPSKAFAFLSVESSRGYEAQAQKALHVVARILAGDGTIQEAEFREEDGMLCIPRAVEEQVINQAIIDRAGGAMLRVLPFGHGPALKLDVESPGLLDSIRFIKDSEPDLPLGPEEIEIEVKASGLNFKDCLTALGKVNQSRIGNECAGTVSRVGGNVREPKVGDRVTGCVQDTFKTYARALAGCFIAIPDDMGFDVAASWPVNFCTAWHALVEVGRLSAGESVLIHSGAGGTGQAAIQIAQHLEAEVFATVGTSEKKEFLMKEYGIPATHIFYSRDTVFAKSIKRLTKRNLGVDMVLNSLSGHALLASWDCMAPYGRFMEIGIKDINDNNPLPMSAFQNNVSFCAVNMATITTERPQLIQKCLKCILPLMQKGRFRYAEPLVRTSLSDIEGAFRYLQSGKNWGKMVLTLDQNDTVRTYLEAQPTYKFEPEATYVISGAFGGLGRSIARWLVERGAKNLLLLSRSGARTQAAIDLLGDLQAQNVRVEALPCDISDAAALRRVLDHSALPPIKGCIQSAMVLRDAVFETMTHADFKTSTDPKIRGSWNLHAQCPAGMDFFVLLSSVTGIFGSPGQANYCAGNTYMDALARLRTTAGEKAISLDLGVMASEGFLAENQDFLNRWIGPGYFTQIEQEQLFAMLDYYCDPEREVQPPEASQVFCGIETPANLRAKGIEPPRWMAAPLFRHMHRIPASAALAASVAENLGSDAVDYPRLFAQAESSADASAVVVRGIVEKLSRALSVPAEEMQAAAEEAKSLQAQGVDSLIAVELRNWLARDFQAEVAIFDIMGAASLVGLGALVEGRSKLRQTKGGE